jgi:hypothetical protein
VNKDQKEARVSEDQEDHKEKRVSASREIKDHKDLKAQKVNEDLRESMDQRETLADKVFVANLAQLEHKENKVYLVLMVLMDQQDQKVHRVHVEKMELKDDQEEMDFQEHKDHKADVVLQENVVPEDLREMLELKVKRVNPQLNLDHQVSMDDQELRVLLEKEAETVLMVFKGQEDHKDQEENLEWLDHQANTITTNFESLFQKLYESSFLENAPNKTISRYLLMLPSWLTEVIQYSLKTSTLSEIGFLMSLTLLNPPNVQGVSKWTSFSILREISLKLMTLLRLTPAKSRTKL